MTSISRAGFCAIVGRPNVGKSTLLNQLLGQKLAIVTPKPQTTRNRIQGILTTGEAQIILVDTPGMHAGRGPLHRYMAEQTRAALGEVDVIVCMAEAPRPPDDFVIDRLEQVQKPKVLVLNKVDRVSDKSALLPCIEAWAKRGVCEEVIPISALKADGLDRVRASIAQRLPLSPPLFPIEEFTDASERFLAAERIREQVFLLIAKEVPYQTAVTIDRYVEAEGQRTIDATIHVERAHQKAILVGRGGQRIKEIGMRARHEIGELLGLVVHLRLFVRVDPDWSGRLTKLKEMGYG